MLCLLLTDVGPSQAKYWYRWHPCLQSCVRIARSFTALYLTNLRYFCSRLESVIIAIVCSLSFSVHITAVAERDVMLA